jgi:tetratricopeptide (TPR) repeat protein
MNDSPINMRTIGGEQAVGEQDAWALLAKYFRQPKLLLTTLVLVTGVLYSGTLFFQFVWDDGPQIVDNPLIRSWHSLSRVFVSDLWYHTTRQQVYYRPLFVAWSIVNYALVGLRPWGWHLGAILLHLGATLAVYWLSRRLGLEYWTAALATLIFALHPIHIECVAWISAASDSMVTMFAALAFVAFVNARDPDATRKSGWRVASFILLACALLTKEMAISFTALVGIHAWLFPRQKGSGAWERSRDALASMVPYAVVTAGYFLLRKVALSHAPLQFDVKHGYGDMALTVPYVVAFYLRQLVLPLGLTGLYFTPYVTTRIFTQFVLPVLLLAAVAGVIYFWARKTSDWVVAFAGCWLLVGLAPALYLRNFGNGDFVRDRYIYLPSIGFAILIAKGLRRLPSFSNWSAHTVQACAALVLCSGYMCASISQQVYWGNDFLLVRRGQSLYPGNPYAVAGLAKEYSQRGAHDLAIELAQSVVRDHPEYEYGPLALAEAYIHAGRFEEGRLWLEKVNPEYAKSEVGKAGVAGLYGQMGDYERALALCADVLKQEPDLYSALYNCGNVHLMDGQYKEAEQLLWRAVQLAPEQAAPKHFLGRALLNQGRNEEAQPYLLQAVAMGPQVWDYHYWLAVSLEHSGNMSAARTEYRRAVQLNQDSKEAKMRLTALEAK